MHYMGGAGLSKGKGVEGDQDSIGEGEATSGKMPVSWLCAQLFKLISFMICLHMLFLFKVANTLLKKQG